MSRLPEERFLLSTGEDIDIEGSDGEALAPAAKDAASQRRSRSRALGAAAGAVLLGIAAVSSTSGILSFLSRGAPAVTHLNELRIDAIQQESTFLVQKDLRPLEDLGDGNPCDVNEELFEGLCYRSCAMLTAGAATIRTSAFTCCAHHPCTPLNQMKKIGMCSGYDVAADGSCPHKPGACLVDEELHMGQCYKKCVLLTHGRFPHRTGAATCCKAHGFGCLNPLNDITDEALAIGGGAGDGDPSTPAEAHPPMQSLTESSASLQALELHEAASSHQAHREVDVVEFEPTEHTHDGNLCREGEELYGGLCYAKCSILTKGLAPLRTSSWTCCEGHPCYLWKQHGSLGSTLLCNGFDTSEDGGCPHKPGACLVDEELYVGVCYKKCSLLTDGEYPHRSAPATCCKTKGIGCLDIRNDKTSQAFDVGGGNSTRDGFAHMPEQRLTEATVDKVESDKDLVATVG